MSLRAIERAGWVLSAGALATALAAASPTVRQTTARLPLRFEINEGQTDGRVRFLVRGQGATLFLTPAEAVFALRAPHGQNVIRMRLVGSNPNPEISGEEELPGISNYFIGNDPSRWRTSVRSYARVRYRDVYPGIDLVYHESEGRVEHDFVVRPGGDPASIRLSFEGVQGLCADAAGDLTLETGSGAVLRLLRPTAFTLQGACREPVVSRIVLGGGELRFAVGETDPNATLVIDPVLVFSTYLGGSAADSAAGVAVDSTGIYVAGYTASPDFPLVSPLQTTVGAGVAFVAKLNPAASALVFSTYLGGTGGDGAAGVGVDGAGSVYVGGDTNSADFPVVAAPQPFYGGFRDGFAARLNPAGDSLVFSTYVGGSNEEFLEGLAVDGAGNTYVTGYTKSTNFPTVNPYQATNLGWEDAFVTKIPPAGLTFTYSTYLGGAGSDMGESIAVGASGDAIVAGATGSPNFPTMLPFQPSRNGIEDGFVTRFDPLGSSLLYSTFLGGEAQDRVYSVAVGPAGDLFLTGWTSSNNFPTANPLQPTCGSTPCNTGFVTSLDGSGSVLRYSTYLGADSDTPDGIAVDGSGAAYVTGLSSSGAFPLICSLQSPAGPDDAFLAKIEPGGGGLEYSTLLGGIGNDSASGLTVDGLGGAFVTGTTYSTDFPVVSAFQPIFGGGLTDGFVAKLADSPCNDPTAGFTGSPRIGPLPLLVQFTDQSTGTITSRLWTFGDGSTSTATSPVHTYATAGIFDVSLTVTGPGGSDTATRQAYIHAGADDFVAGPGRGPANPNQARILTLGGTVAQSWLAYGAGGYGTIVASGDVDGSIAEVFTGPGPGMMFGPQVRAFRADASPVAKINYYAYGTLRYGVNVSGGDVDGDTYAEIVTGPGPGAVFGPHVRGFNYDGVQLAALAKISYYAYGTLKYGVNVGEGDVEGDGFAEIVTGPGPSAAFAPQVRGWNYDNGTIAPIPGINANVFTPLQYGCNVAAGDVTADARDDGIFGRGPGPALAEDVRGFSLSGGPMAPLPGLNATVFAGLGYGLNPAAGDVDADGTDGVVGGQGPDPAATSGLRGYDYTGSSLAPVAGADFDAFTGLAYGARPGLGLLGY